MQSSWTKKFVETGPAGTIVLVLEYLLRMSIVHQNLYIIDEIVKFSKPVTISIYLMGLVLVDSWNTGMPLCGTRSYRPCKCGDRRNVASVYLRIENLCGDFRSKSEAAR
jgi:hypothetical protein